MYNRGRDSGHVGIAPLGRCRKDPLKTCAARESNPSRKNGNLAWYHYTSGAIFHVKIKNKTVSFIFFIFHYLRFYNIDVVAAYIGWRKKSGVYPVTRPCSKEGTKEEKNSSSMFNYVDYRQNFTYLTPCFLTMWHLGFSLGLHCAVYANLVGQQLFIML